MENAALIPHTTIDAVTITLFCFQIAILKTSMRTSFGELVGIMKELAGTYTRREINSVEADKVKKVKSLKRDIGRV